MSRPNVLFVFADQQRWDSLGLNGCPLDLTPNMDRMAMRGTFLKNLFTCQPVCGPARSCLQSGMFATRTGCHRNGPPLPPSPDNLGEVFSRAGYDTGYIGKWHLADWAKTRSSGPVVGEDRGGYRYWLAANALEMTSDAYHTRLWDADNQPVDLPGYRVDAMTDAAIRWIARPRDDPFFLFLSFLEPHHQNHLDDYPPPLGYRERFTGRWTPPDLAALGGSSPQHLGGYWGMIKRLDEAFGRLVDCLHSLDLLENTILVFTSDHGCHFKTRNAEYKRSCHDASIRVPGLICGPGFESGGERRELVSLIDLPPTLLEAAGLPVPACYDGRALGPLVRREVTDWPESVFVQISESHVGRAVRTHRWKYAVAAPEPESGWDDRAWADEMRESFLYDLDCDPYELTNLVHSAAHAPVRERMRALLLRHMEEAGESLPRIHPAVPDEGFSQRKVSENEVGQ
jgi:arylsulfatase A-like enzyme